ncbi:hypothetical protein [Clostridium estertheticum]|uniref:Phage tail assembly protein n=1 Tax=Clostridium estertheticum subsp. estertheticum TaxID=1552 RepID=A0A1J0GJJ4_9CLOT|nr:hypothetical protein [Clostridium estertheticum]APC41525.1 hypothetical protein A7L45_16290 [Clostridium estertheticum subsp. estertheticum]
MFNLNTINKRYWDIKLRLIVTKIVDKKEIEEEVELNLEVEPPSKKMLTKITALSGTKDGKKATDGLYDAVEMLLNKNKVRTKITAESLSNLNLDQINAILTSYFEWLSKTKDSKN